MQIALDDLALDQLTVIFSGEGNYRLTENIEVIGLTDYLRDPS